MVGLSSSHAREAISGSGCLWTFLNALRLEPEVSGCLALDCGLFARACKVQRHVSCDGYSRIGPGT